MAQPMIDCLIKLQNNRINCFNNRDIACLQFLTKHPSINVRNLAMITLARCTGGRGSKKKRKKRKTRKTRRKPRRKRKTRRKK